MKPYFVAVVLAAAVLAATGFRQSPEKTAQTTRLTTSELEGRWDLTLQANGETYPSWIEISNAGTPSVRIVDRTGSVHPASDVKIDGSHVTFSERNGKATWDLSVSGGKLSGTENLPNGKAEVTGVRAPALDRKAPQSWSAPEPLFNGKNLDGWIPDKPDKNHWKVENGELVNEAPGANIRTERKFDDFKLHIEFNCPVDGNSGIYLRGRYEVQVEYETRKEDPFHQIGSIYGFLAPSKQLPARPGQWESFDVTLVGRTVTIVRDGVTTINAQKIPGITGGALDSHEGEPGPIYLQGDHTGGMKYRNITIATAQ
ncbi:MAG TPA: DUF1080 domain-containing protein [Bryobacteraceae bacterium]|jgi:hypothetical protein|nr:DUF1080 domain-containing protein [Bryobacteraceae bacterium]